MNTLVDALNLSSLRAQLPFGLYDLDRVKPPIVLRRGAPGESYEGIRKAAVNVEGRPVLVDAQGPFGNPTHDSGRTRITERSVRALVIAFAPGDTPRAALEEVVREIGSTAKDFCGGRVAVSGILPP